MVLIVLCKGKIGSSFINTVLNNEKRPTLWRTIMFLDSMLESLEKSISLVSNSESVMKIKRLMRTKVLNRKNMCKARVKRRIGGA